MLNITKLQHLLDAVKGRAAERLRSVSLVGSNFSVAWERLLRRYDNPPLRLTTHLEALIQLDQVRSQNARDLSSLIDKAEILVKSLEDLNVPLSISNHFVVHCVVRKLDMQTRQDWNISQEGNLEFPSYQKLSKFIERRAQSLEKTQSSNVSESISKQFQRGGSYKPTRFVKSNAAIMDESSKTTCSFCKGAHVLYQCAVFKSKMQSERFNHCKKEGLCLNCLGRSHRLSNCPSKKRYFLCKGKHHTLLHMKQPSKVDEKQEPLSIEDPSPSCSNVDVIAASTSTLAHSTRLTRTVLLATANIIVSNPQGSSIVVRALIDPAAEGSFISNRIATLLSLPRKKVAVAVLGVGAAISGKAVGEVTLTLKSKFDSEFELSTSALVLNVICQSLPSSRILLKNWPHLENLYLADSRYFISSKIDAVLGADIYPEILREGFVKGPPESPLAQLTAFGWILTGSVSKDSSSQSSSLSAYHTRIDCSVGEILKKFWEIEEVPSKRILSAADQECENLFASTTSRLSDGRFMVRLPFARRVPLTNTKASALACLRKSVARRSKNSSVDEAYRGFMSEYEKLGHMKLASVAEQQSAQCYLPHHAVFRNDDTKKIRVVFNASHKYQNGYSLNDLLYAGPKLQADITAIISNWRFYSVVFTSDIVKMFRQILVHPDDTRWQHVLWQESQDAPILDFVALTVTYGTAPAPFLAIRTLLRLADDGKSEFPQAAEILRRQTYVDDVFSGANSLQHAMERRDELIKLLRTAGMNLGKWAANDVRLLQGLSPSSDSVSVELDETVSALDLRWRPSSDTFTFSLTLPSSPSIITKRIVLSETSRLFDPLGWLVPVIIVPKLIMQGLWLQQLDWDVPLPAELRDRWLEFRTSLTELEGISISRYTGIETDRPWHLHGFCDASKRAYAAVVYSVSLDGKVTLLMAKTKVSPLKVQSLPRLELCGALLLVRLVHHLIENLIASPQSLNFWTDSKVVLDWLKSHPSKWQTFVANRVSEIQTTFPTAVWRHVVSHENPDDPATRGVQPSQREPECLWWVGPSWLNSFDHSKSADLSLTGVFDRETLVHVSQEACRPPSEESTSTLISDDVYSY